MIADRAKINGKFFFNSIIKRQQQNKHNIKNYMENFPKKEK